MDEKDIALFSEYARLKNEEGAIKERLVVLAPDILEKMLAIDGVDTKVETAIGSFTIRKTKDWVYPEAINTAEENLKTAKKQAQKVGDATYDEVPGLSFRRKAV